MDAANERTGILWVTQAVQHVKSPAAGKVIQAKFQCILAWRRVGGDGQRIYPVGNDLAGLPGGRRIKVAHRHTVFLADQSARRVEQMGEDGV